jgi:hypothetical protein
LLKRGLLVQDRAAARRHELVAAGSKRGIKMNRYYITYKIADFFLALTVRSFRDVSLYETGFLAEWIFLTYNEHAK